MDAFGQFASLNKDYIFIKRWWFKSYNDKPTIQSIDTLRAIAKVMNINVNE